jgi:DNA helicase-4
MKVGERVRHVGWSGHDYGEIIELFPDGRCSVVYPDGSSYSGIRQEAIESVEVELEEQRRDQAKQQVISRLESGDLAGATAWYERECADWWPISEFEAQRLRCIQIAEAREAALGEQRIAQEAARREQLEVENRQQLKSQVSTLMDGGNYAGADRLYRDACQGWWPQNEYEMFRRGAMYAQRFADIYRTASLADLDNFFKNHQGEVELSADDYVALKAPRVDRALQAMGLTLDHEQLCANARPENRLLITARAGSGKTRTLCAKAALSIQDEGLYPDQVMILAFNKAAALTVKQRLEEGGLIKDYRNARTFHSLAYQLVKPRKKLLFDAGGEPSKRDQSRFAQRMMQRILNPAFKEAMVEFFRQELEQIEDLGRDLPPNDYLIFRRSLELVTLDGKRVKSNGEKFIADFLFEHGIEYRYERPWAWKADFLDGSVYRPDFSIVHGGYDYILEHWAIEPEDPTSTLPSHWTTTTAQYRAQIKAKRAFWQGHSMELLETHTGMLRQGRAAFESQLKEILLGQGIRCQRLPQEEIVRRVFQNDFAISRMAELFLQFIQRAKKMGWSVDRVAGLMAEHPDPEPRARLFHDLALRAYREYEAMLIAEGAMDFDDLLAQAADEVVARGASLSIHLGDGKMLPLRELRWVLLDEYQDFSELYFRMLSAILEVNPGIKLVAVGDDWQAINAFAGADLLFFRQFSDYFPNSSAVGVTTNYRSDSLVVNAGNRLMVGQGPAAKRGRSLVGEIQVCNIHDVWIEFRAGDAYLEEREADAVYLPVSNEGKRPSPSVEKLAKAVKACVERISENPDRKVLLLARTGIVYGLEMEGFMRLLLTALKKTLQLPMKDLESLVSAMTAHGSKGQEAHTVIILDATQRQFPKVHPDNLLFRPFGVTPKAVLDEERRLFYVALTRAEHRLIVLTEKGSESPYLRALKPNRFDNYFGENKSMQNAELSDLALRIKTRLEATGEITSL